MLHPCGTSMTPPVTISCRKDSPSSQYYCRNYMQISTYAHLGSSVSCFGTHLASFDTWAPHWWWNMQLKSNLLAMAITVIYLLSWTRALTSSIVITICYVVRQPKRSLVTLVCHLGSFLPIGTSSFVWYSFLYIVLTLFCEFQRFLPHLTTKIEWQNISLTMVQYKSRAKLLLWLCKLHWTLRLHCSIPRLGLVYSMHVCKNTLANYQIVHANCPYFLNSLCIIKRCIFCAIH